MNEFLSLGKFFGYLQSCPVCAKSLGPEMIQSLWVPHVSLPLQRPSSGVCEALVQHWAPKVSCITTAHLFLISAWRAYLSGKMCLVSKVWLLVKPPFLKFQGGMIQEICETRLPAPNKQKTTARSTRTAVEVTYPLVFRNVGMQISG